MSSFYWRIVALGLLAMILEACSGSSGSGASGPGQLGADQVVVVVIFDTSKSEPAIRERYRAGFAKIINGLVGDGKKKKDGDPREIVVLGDKISERSEATASYPINITFDPSGGMTGPNPLQVRKARDKARQQSLEQLDSVLDRKNQATGTDIMGTLRLAESAYASHPQAEKHLVLFSDMVEQTGRYNFYSLKADQFDEILLKEKQANNVPRLEGVHVWIVGLGAAGKGGLPSEQLKRIRDFWLAYFKEAGADAGIGRIVPDLADFKLVGK